MTGSASRKNLEHPASEHAVTCLWQAKPCRVFTAQNCPDHRQGSNVLLLSLHKCMQKPVRRIPFTERTGLGKLATPFDFLHTPFFFCFLRSLKVAIITIFNMQQEFPRKRVSEQGVCSNTKRHCWIEPTLPQQAACDTQERKHFASFIF